MALTQSLQSKKTYREICLEFLQQSSIHGLKIFLLNVNTKIAKKLWFWFIVLVIFWTHFIIINLILDFAQQPTELHMSTNMVHVGNSPFPGIGLCSANKISRRKLQVLADQVFHAQQAYKPHLLTRNEQDMAEKLIILAGFYLHPYQEFNIDVQELERLHDIFGYMHNNASYSLRDILHNLAPDCSELVIRGLVLGEPINISNYVVKRTTSASICCMFNYKRQSYTWNITRKIMENKISFGANNISFESNSVLNSLQFVMQMDEDDIVYTDLSNNAFQINIFPNEDYAPVQSNTVGEFLVEHNTVIEIPIQPRIFASSNQIRNFSPKIRKCYFPEEGQRILNSTYYSMDECLLICRMDSMIRYCGCVSPPMVATTLNVTYCAIIDLPCLVKWKSIWYGWNFFDYVHANERDFKSSYEGCDHCLPTCDGVEFDFDVNILRIRSAINGKYTQGLLAGLTNSKPLAIIKLFFEEREVKETIEDVVADWILLINRFGGILSLMYGFSIISYIEVFFYLSGKWFLHLCTKNSRTKSLQIVVLEKRDPPRYPELYWQELNKKYFQNLNNFQKSLNLQAVEKKM